MRHEEDEEEEGGGKKGGRKERMMIGIMASWALGMCCGDGFFELCKKGTRFITNTETTDLWVSDSCVWVKPGIYCSS